MVGRLVVMVWTLEFDSKVWKFRVDQKNRDIKTHPPKKKLKKKKSVSRKQADLHDANEVGFGVALGIYR